MLKYITANDRKKCRRMNKNRKEVVDSWEYIREKGMREYIVGKIITLGVMMALVYVLNLFLLKI